jgi:hypothetical protein
MLKITLNDSAEALCFRLEGRLSGAWVGELRRCWLAAQPTPGRKTTLDLGEVDYADAAGQALIAEMHRQGVILRAVTPLMRGLIEEIERAGRCATVEEASGKRADVFDSTHPARPRRRAV